jgi:hypothetical protein
MRTLMLAGPLAVAGFAVGFRACFAAGAAVWEDFRAGAALAAVLVEAFLVVLRGAFADLRVAMI